MARQKVRGLIRINGQGPSIIDDSVVYVDGVPSNIPSYNVFPAAINTRGEVVGTFWSCSIVAPCRRAFYYYNHRFHLIDPLPPGSSVGVSLTGINDKGIIFGTYDDRNPANGRTGYFFIGYPAGTQPLNKPVSSKLTLTAIPAGTYYRINASHSGQVLDITANSCADGAKAIQWLNNNGDNQLWTFQPTGKGTYTIVNRASMKVLDVDGASTANGVKLQQWRRIPNALNQEFRIEPVDSGLYRITAAHSGKVLDIEGASIAAGASLIQWPWGAVDNANQRFRLDAVTSAAPVRLTCR